MNATAIIDELTYRSFAANRDLGMSAERYARLIRVDAAAYEARYQRERGKTTEPMVVDLREPLDVVCGLCGMKHCHGHADDRSAGR